MHWHSHWERVFGTTRGRKRYIQLSRLNSKKQKKIVKSQFVKLAIKSIQKLHKTNNKQKKIKEKTNRNGRRKDGARRLPHHHCPPYKTNKQERTEAEAWKQILEKRVSKFFNKATAPVNKYVKSQNLSSFNKCLVFCLNM